MNSSLKITFKIQWLAFMQLFTITLFPAGPTGTGFKMFDGCCWNDGVLWVISNRNSIPLERTLWGRALVVTTSSLSPAVVFASLNGFPVHRLDSFQLIYRCLISLISAFFLLMITLTFKRTVNKFCLLKVVEPFYGRAWLKAAQTLIQEALKWFYLMLSHVIGVDF